MNGYKNVNGSNESRTSGNGRYARNLFYLSLIEAGWGLGGAFVSPGAVLPLLLSAMGASLSTIGLLPGLGSLATTLPQLVAAHRTAGLASQTPFVVRWHVLPTFAFLAVAAVAWRGGSGSLAVGLLYGALTLWYLGLGYVTPVWLAFAGRLAGPERRGHFFGVLSMAGLLGGVAGAWLCALLLGLLPAPVSYAAGALVAFAAMNLANLGWFGVEEPAREPEELAATASRREPLPAYLRRLYASVAGNSRFVRFLAAQQLVSLHSVLGAFYLVNAQRQFGASPERVMALSGVAMAAQAVGSVLYAAVADRLGALNTLAASQLLLLAAMGQALSARSAEELTPVAILLGLFYGSYFNAKTTAVMELARGGDSAAYQAVNNLVMTPAAVLIPAAAGWATESYGYPAVLSTALAATVAGTVLLVAGRAPALLGGLRLAFGRLALVSRQLRLSATLW